MDQNERDGTAPAKDVDPFVPPKTDFSDHSKATHKASRRIPFPGLVAVLAGAVFGVLERLIFSGKAGESFTAMGGAFIFIAPALMGAVTVFIAELDKQRSLGYHMSASALATALAITGTLFILIEGWICALLIYPLFMLEGILGGMAMLIVIRFSNWARRLLVAAFALMLVCGALEPLIPLPRRDGEVVRTIVIHAPADVIWREIADARDIQPQETEKAWSARIGVPRPLEGRVEQRPEGRVRKVTWDKNVHFDEVITDWQEDRHMAWDFRFQPDSFPEHALDDHVTIGGTYFDLKNADFTLTPRGDSTEVRLVIRYRLSTRFNWYSDELAQGLMGNFQETILGMYRQRSEAAAKASGQKPSPIAKAG